MAGRAPVGWPADLPPPGTPEFWDRAPAWLLDLADPDMRTSELRSLPLALVRVVAHQIDAAIDGTRRAYASARVELGGVLSAAEVSRVQAALEAQGARLLRVQRQLGLVEEAMRRYHPEGDSIA